VIAASAISGGTTIRERMTSVLDPGVLARADQLSRDFAEAKPFRHVVIEPFLEAGFCADLMAQFPHFNRDKALNESGEVAGKAVFSNLAGLGPAYARFDRLMQDGEFLALTGRITGIPKLLYDPEYVGGGTHENLPGQELDTHVDFNFHPTTHTHRRLNLIVFLNAEWQQDWGGCLELLRDPFDTECQTVVPLANRAVIFETTEASWHGFRKIQMPPGKEASRRSIAVYFYTKEAPAAGAAPSHATFYYQRPMPAHLREGRTLTDGDVRELEGLFARRDHYIRFLYQREMKFNQTLEKIIHSPTFRLAAQFAKVAKLVRGKNRDGA
jgi:Rps23 Pro-64 3,4-dihydroxylase Tpa1-like proline 4-hydroxylase